MKNSTGSRDVVYQLLRPFLRELGRILDHSVKSAVSDFEDRGRPIDPWHLASHVRNETKGMLEELAGTSLECEIEQVANNGLLVRIWGHAVKVMKSDDGELPSAKGRPALGHYYEQISLFDPPVIHQLVVLWSFDSTTHSLGDMLLVLPNEWAVGIEAPETVVAAGASLAEAPNTADLQEYQYEDEAEDNADERKEGASGGADGEEKD